MEYYERELYVSRMISGMTRIKLEGQIYYFGPVSRHARYLSNEIYRDVLQDCLFNEIIPQTDMLPLLQSRGLWCKKDGEQLDLLVKKLDDLKIGLCEKWDRIDERISIKAAIQKGRDEIVRLEGIKHSLDHLSAESVALSAKMRFMAGSSLLYSDQSNYWLCPESDWNKPDDILDELMELLAETRLNESGMRNIVRNEPWRSIWTARKHTLGVFDVPSVDLDDEQRSLVIWSSIYDSIREHPECPGDDMFEDDDAIDGWMMTQKRKQKEGGTNNQTDSKASNAQEVFIPINREHNQMTIEQIEALNNDESKFAKLRRMKFLKEHKEVNEVYMPDTAQEIQMELARLEAQKIRGGR